MDNKLGLVSLFSVIILIATYFMSSNRIDKMFDLAELEINQVDGPAVSRNLNESFSAEEKINKRKNIETINNFKEVEKILSNMEVEINKLSKECSIDIESHFKNKDIIDPNSEFYKDFKNVDKSLSLITSILNEYILAGVIINRDIQQIVQGEKLNRKIIKKILKINENLDLCNVNEMDNFIITSMESMSLHQRSKREIEMYRYRLINFILPFFKIMVHDSGLYRGIGTLKLAFQNDILKGHDEDYIDNLHIMLEERRDELKFQTRKIEDIDRLRDYFLEEYQWQEGFAQEIGEYFNHHYPPEVPSYLSAYSIQR